MKRKKYNGTGMNYFLLKANFYDDDEEFSYPNLRALRKKNLNKLIIAHLSVNSLRNKLEFLKEQIQDKIDNIP